MTFKETLLYEVLTIPVDVWRRENIYSVTLISPLLILSLLIGVPMALIVDSWSAIKNIYD